MTLFEILRANEHHLLGVFALAIGLMAVLMGVPV